jgi:hypothetical protein
VRSTTWLLVVISACHPSATVENTMPVANLQSYRTVALRVKSTAFASQGQAMLLESQVLEKLHQKCGFEQVGRASTTPADVMLDLNITGTGRGGGGWITNSSVATIDTLLVLSDGQNGELLGTARIHGKSSGMIVNSSVPENEAVEVVATTVADLLAKSGCSGPRTRPEPPPPPPDTGSGSAPPPPEEKHSAEAEALNEQGKDKLRSADIPGALAAFQRANTLAPDARFEFNVCLALEAQEKWNDAIAACKQARSMNPQAKLATKIDHRLDLLQHHQ